MIYADYNGSAPICSSVTAYLKERLDNGPFANPNAIHYLGQKTFGGMEKARTFCSKILGAHPSQMSFNSGSTEGISQVFKSLCVTTKESQRNLMIISGLEHSAILNNACHYNEMFGHEVRVLPVLENGLVDLNTLYDWIAKDGHRTLLVSIMAANNETGVIQPYKEIAKACTESKVPYVCDTTQLIGKGEFNFEESGVDYAFLSSHKIGGLIGSGILFAKKPEALKPLVIGGNQENGLRGGTQNYVAHETIAVALNEFQEKMSQLIDLKEKRQKFEHDLKSLFPNLVIFGESSPRLAGTTFLSLPGIHGQAVQIELESQGIYVTTSSACSDNEPTTSKVLKSMQVTDDVGRGAIRISFGLCSPLDSYDKIAECLEKAFNKLSKIKSF